MTLLSNEKLESLSLVQLQCEQEAAKKVVRQLEEMKQDALTDIEKFEGEINKRLQR